MNGKEEYRGILIKQQIAGNDNNNNTQNLTRPTLLIQYKIQNRRLAFTIVLGSWTTGPGFISSCYSTHPVQN